MSTVRPPLHRSLKTLYTTLCLGIALSVTAAAALKNPTLRWGQVTDDPSEKAFAQFVGGTDNSGYAYADGNNRSPSEMSMGFTGKLFSTLQEPDGSDLHLELLYMGGSTRHTREFGFDISFGGMTAEVILAEPIKGSGEKAPTNPDPNLGTLFNASLKEIVAATGADPASVFFVEIDFFVRAVDTPGNDGALGQKVFASDGIGVFDYSPFVESTPQPFNFNANGDSSIKSVPGGFPEGYSRVWGWEDHVQADNSQAGYSLQDEEADFNDFIMGFVVQPQRIITSVPEPSAYGFIAAALLATLAFRRRYLRKK